MKSLLRVQFLKTVLHSCPPSTRCTRTLVIAHRNLIHANKQSRNLSYESRDNDQEWDDEEQEVMQDLENKLRSVRLAKDPHQVFIIQPYIKWGPKKKKNTTPQLQLEEAIALISTLPQWRVVSTQIVPLESFDKKLFFSKGHLENIRQITKREQTISSVFVNVKSLKLPQHLALEEELGVPVFDRHSVVINIFKNHAKTKEAKLQVSLAEIPYFWSRIQGINEGEVFQTNNVGISGETWAEKRLRILRERERKIKDEIGKLRENRVNMRSKRREREFPTVAVVGYTNAGKTSLIKALTQEAKLKPENKLFATLDVTLHAATLPSNVKILLIDTIGFISDIPSNLLEPFVVTLEDAIWADVIIHVQDLSHPDCNAQAETVRKTLQSLNLPKNLLETIITVGNKIDKFDSSSQSIPEGVIPVSCKDGCGLETLIEKLESQVYVNTGLKRIKIKVSNGGEEYHWLCKEAAVFSAEEDSKDPNFLVLGVAITNARLQKFKHEFIFKASGRT